MAGRLQLAGSTGEAEQFSEALTLATAVTADCARAFSPDHELVLAGRHQQALWAALSDQSDRAIAQFTALLTDCERLLGPDHPLTEDCHKQRAQPGRTVWYHLPPSR